MSNLSDLRPVLSKLLSAKSSGYLDKQGLSGTSHVVGEYQTAHSFLIELTTALVKGEPLSVVYVLILKT